MPLIPPLTLVPAGAGSGKTYRIKEQLADWVVAGAVHPARIAAVTFTESAAGELRDRIRTELMARGRLEDALCLDQSFIATIHGFGNRLLLEYAFEAGGSPRARLVDEEEERLLLRKAIARIDQVAAIGRDLGRFGYRWDPNTGMDAAEAFRNRILDCVQRFRVIGGGILRAQRLAHALHYIEQTYGPTDDGPALTDALRRATQRLLHAYPHCMRDYVTSESAQQKVAQDHRHLCEAAHTDALTDNWRLWRDLQTLKVFKKDNQLPADYQALARQVIAHADALQHHPGPLADARRHTEALLTIAWEALGDYAGRKQDRGIIDYTDMIDMGRRLLADPRVMAHAARRFDCLVIDEFQDTNPLQFAMLWQLHRQGVPALVVGDLKQSIMGFQSADPRLMHSLIHHHREQCRPLTANWRSQAPLLDVVNAAGRNMFGDAYTALAPKAPFSSRLSPLSAIVFQGKNITNQVQAQHVAARIQAMLNEDRIEVYDTRQKCHRPVRGSDIAVLGQTHARLHEYAAALAAIGVRAQLEQDGWFESRPVQLLYHGLSLVADPADRHAALYLAVTELGDTDLAGAASTLLETDRLYTPLHQQLQALAEQAPAHTVDELLARTIDTMGLYDTVAQWPGAAQARANLLRLQHEAETFTRTDPEVLAAAGHYGSGLKTFLAWLAHRVTDKEGDRQPAPRVQDEEAVQLLTWHAAKGKEWPIVVVATLDRGAAGQLPSLDIEYTAFDDLDAILDNARIRFSPDFVAKETKDRFKASLNEKARTEGLNLLYVALTRAREQLVLEWPENLLNSKRFTYWHLLREAAGMHLRANQIQVGDTPFPCAVTAADATPPPPFETAPTNAAAPLPRIGRRALQPMATPHPLTPAFATPSALHGQTVAPLPGSVQTISYGQPLSLSLPPGVERGLIVHRAIELLGRQVPAAMARKAIGEILQDSDWRQLETMTTTFIKMLQKRFRPVQLHWEVPIVAADQNSTVINGTIDLLAQTAEGYWIIDHKSDETADREARFQSYLPQLYCYAKALSEGMGWGLAGVAVHWACEGEISCFVLPVI